MIISFEGIDGSGKSTQAKRLMTRLAEPSRELLYVREPGGTDISERVRDLLLDAELDMHPFSEMLLFSAARAQLVREKIMPVHKRQGLVICDRYFDSTIAYQGGGRRVADSAWLDSFQREVIGGLIPDRTYLIRISVQQAKSRLEGRFGEEQAADRLELAGDAFFDRVHAEYDRLAAQEPERYCVIDGSATPDEVEQAVWEDARHLLEH